MADLFFEKAAAAIGSLPNANAFKETERDYDSKAFGNAYITYEAPELIIRFVTDRDEIRIDIAANTQMEWLMLNQICELLEKTLPGLDFESNAQTLLNNYNAIINLLSKEALPQTIISLKRIGQKRTQAIFSRFS